ncbi:MAG: helix-turn-helix domain-containing protein [Haloarculaceae archaeon]
MRYVTVLVQAKGGPIHPTEKPVADDPSLTRVAFHRVELLEDETGIVLVELRGDKERYREILDADDRIHDYTVSGGDTWYSYVHFEPNEPLRAFLATQRESEVILEMPVEILDDYEYRVTFVGRETQFQAELDAMPPFVDIRVLRTGTYRPDVGQLLGELTARQREILEVAFEAGYYEDPRQTTHQDIAERVGCTSATVGEHLRKVEARVFAELLGRE